MSTRTSESPPRHASTLRLGYVIGTYPRLTTTFIDREVRALQSLNAPPTIISIRRPGGDLSAEQELLRNAVTYLLPVHARRFVCAHLRFAVLRPVLYFGTVLYLLTRHHPDVKSRLRTFLHFLEAVFAARILERSRCNHIHAHFVDRAATVALVVSRLLKVPYSVTAHANDIYVKPILLAEKLGRAAFATTCTGFNKSYLEQLVGPVTGRRLFCVYHGLEVDRFRPRCDGNRARPLVLAVGQLKEKKGFVHLLRACRTLRDRGYEFDCHIVGEGPDRNLLENVLRTLSLQETVTLCGALPQEQVIAKYNQAAIFVLPCVVGSDGDRDGIPNVILEAMAMQLPVVSSRHSGIPEAIQDGVNGLLVSPGDDTALAAAIGQLLRSPDERERLGQTARQRVVDRFSLNTNVALLLELFAGRKAISHEFLGQHLGG